MPEIILGVVVLLLALWAVNSFSKADPKAVARVLRGIGGVIALAAAGYLLVRGEFGLGVPLGLVGLGALGWISARPRDLFAAYFYRRAPGGGEYAQHDAAAGSGGSRPAAGAKMTEEEAYQILGIEPGASAADISRAHRTLMKKLHPDQGGTTYLATRVNQAKDVLLRRHR